MSWVDKAHQRHRIDKMIEQAMRTPKYQEAKRREQEQATLQALGRFCFLACEFLELRHGYKHNGLDRFLDWTRCRVEEIGEDESYFRDVDEYYKEYYDLDVLSVLGMKFERGNE